MNQEIYCVYDAKAEMYGPPLCFNTGGEAIRWFDDLANGRLNKAHVANHPEDYTLFHIGTYDQSTGVVTMAEAKVSMGLALDYVATSPLPVHPGAE